MNFDPETAKQITEIILAFLAYSFLHSFFAAIRVKKWFTEHFPEFTPFYRITYTVTQTVLFFLMMFYLPRPDDSIWNLQGTLYWLFRLVQLTGIIGFIWALSSFSLTEFIGLKQLTQLKSLSAGKENMTDDSFHSQGAFKYMRHPLYFFTIVIFLFEPHMTLFRFLFLTWLIAYIWIGSILEENRMEILFGETYQNYRQKVNRFIPGVFKD